MWKSGKDVDKPDPTRGGLLADYRPLTRQLRRRARRTDPRYWADRGALLAGSRRPTARRPARPHRSGGPRCRRASHPRHPREGRPTMRWRPAARVSPIRRSCHTERTARSSPLALGRLSARLQFAWAATIRGVRAQRPPTWRSCAAGANQHRERRCARRLLAEQARGASERRPEGDTGSLIPLGRPRSR